ncbi:hypothetical protein KA119_00325 [Candidatus Gracilibacteria bacterium]|nr:hypothetical protein [Candidatus Gracilibacteria bacterium]
MKIILSRKGFDSAYGGYASPILPDGRMISLPIPYNDVTKYGDLKFDNDRSYYDVMRQLKPEIRYGRVWHELTKNATCHFDPDINRGPNSAFGQCGSAQGHLRNEKVGTGDLFLFFGWFRQTTWEKGSLQFVKGAPDLHIIFGYLQVEEVIEVKEDSISDKRIKDHCHVKSDSIRKLPNNTIYLASKNLSWDESRSGAGVFDFNQKRVLTKINYPRSQWDLPYAFRNIEISRHSKNSWKDEGYFQSAPIGQEFIIQDRQDCEIAKNWAKNLFD